MTPALFFSGRTSRRHSPLPTTGSGRSGLATSHSGRRLRIGGSWWKFSGGGGEVVAHSSVQAFQGLSPASSPAEQAYDQIPHEEQRRRRHEERADGRDHVHPAPARQVGIGVDAARHAERTRGNAG